MIYFFTDIIDKIAAFFKSIFVFFYKYIIKQFFYLLHNIFLLILSIYKKIDKRIHLKYQIIILIIAFLVIVYFISDNNYYHAYIFYPDKNIKHLKIENRNIIKNIKKIERIRNTVEEALLGPVTNELKNVYPKESKLISLRVDNDILFLNFNREFIMDIENNEKNEENNEKLISIIIKGIVNTVCFQFKNIKKVRFFFDGKEYKYLGKYGPIDKGISPDWTILSK